MSKKQKTLAEKKHKIVHNFLVKTFPDCEVKYNGVEGHDHRIIFEYVSHPSDVTDSIYHKKTTIIETKTCKRLMLILILMRRD